MNLITVICEIIFAVLAANATQDEHYLGERQTGTLRLPFYFDYKRGDYVDATVKLINLSPTVTKLYIKYVEDSQETVKRYISNPAVSEHVLFHHQLLKKETSIRIYLYNKISWCVGIHVFKGTAVDNNKTVDPGFNDNELCLRSSSPCTVEMDLKDKCTDTHQGDVLRPQFHFGYKRGDYFNAVVNFINLSPDNRYFICVEDEVEFSDLKTIDPVSSRALANSSGNNNFNHYSFPHQQLLDKTRNTLFVTLSNKITWFTSINLFHGTAVDSNGAFYAEHKYNAVCLNSTSPCHMEADMANAFSGGYKIFKTLKTSPHDDIATTTESRTKSVTSGSETFKTMKTSPHEDMETTTVRSTASVTNESTSNVTVICSCMAGITFILLVIFASWKCCWLQRRPRATLGLQTNQNNFERFYVNLLFRRECQREIEEIEEHVYEEVGPPIYDEVGPSDVIGNG